MRIDPNAPYVRYVILLDNMDDESKKRLQEHAESVYGSPWELPLKDFFALSSGDLSHIGLEKNDSLKATVNQYVWMLEFREVVEQVTAILKRLQVPQSPEAQRASKNRLEMGFKEAAIVFARRYFGLHSFAEAENVTLADFIIAKKDEFNGAIFQYSMNEIQKQKLKTKK